jgi:hypothetical protein
VQPRSELGALLKGQLFNRAFDLSQTHVVDLITSSAHNQASVLFLKSFT